MLSVAVAQAGMRAREEALYAALDDMEAWLATGTHGLHIHASFTTFACF